MRLVDGGVQKGPRTSWTHVYAIQLAILELSYFSGYLLAALWVSTQELGQRHDGLENRDSK